MGSMRHDAKMRYRLPDLVLRNLICLMEEEPFIDGFAVGGSIAAGRYKPDTGQDVDVDVLLENGTGLDPAEQRDYMELFRERTGVEIQFHSANSRENLTRFLCDRNRPSTIYVFRSERERNLWGAPSPLEAEVYIANH
jgi:hypothetical protein